MNKTCYFCGAPATSGEHAPPKCIFPRIKDTADGTDYRKNLIKVPSCDVHNIEKSSEDEYLLYVLTMSIASNEIGGHHFLSRMHRALVRRPTYLNKLFIKYEHVTIHDTATNKWHRTLAFQIDERRLVSVFTHIAKAIYFQEFACIWTETLSVVTEFTLSFEDLNKNKKQEVLSRQLDILFENVPRKGENQDAFYYQLMQCDGKTILRLSFYETSRVTITGI